MQPDVFFGSISLLIVLLNPFLMTVYLLDLIERASAGLFARVLVRAGVISAVVFSLFACTGDVIFSRLLQVSFQAFQVFGGVIFLLISIRFVVEGSRTIGLLRGTPEHMAGAIAMPFMIGPGTVSASILAGARLSPWWASVAVLIGVAVSVTIVIALKLLHDWVRTRHETLVQRYIDIVGRVSGLIIGTFAADMILRGAASYFNGDAVVPVGG